MAPSRYPGRPRLRSAAAADSLPGPPLAVARRGDAGPQHRGPVVWRAAAPLGLQPERAAALPLDRTSLRRRGGRQRVGAPCLSHDLGPRRPGSAVAGRTPPPGRGGGPGRHRPGGVLSDADPLRQRSQALWDRRPGDAGPHPRAALGDGEPCFGSALDAPPPDGGGRGPRLHPWGVRGGRRDRRLAARSLDSQRAMEMDGGLRGQLGGNRGAPVSLLLPHVGDQRSPSGSLRGRFPVPRHRLRREGTPRSSRHAVSHLRGHRIVDTIPALGVAVVGGGGAADGPRIRGQTQRLPGGSPPRPRRWRWPFRHPRCAATLLGCPGSWCSPRLF